MKAVRIFSHCLLRPFSTNLAYLSYFTTEIYIARLNFNRLKINILQTLFQGTAIMRPDSGYWKWLIKTFW